VGGERGRAEGIDVSERDQTFRLRRQANGISPKSFKDLGVVDQDSRLSRDIRGKQRSRENRGNLRLRVRIIGQQVVSRLVVGWAIDRRSGGDGSLVERLGPRPLHPAVIVHRQQHGGLRALSLSSSPSSAWQQLRYPLGGVVRAPAGLRPWLVSVGIDRRRPDAGAPAGAAHALEVVCRPIAAGPAEDLLQARGRGGGRAVLRSVVHGSPPVLLLRWIWIGDEEDPKQPNRSSLIKE